MRVNRQASTWWSEHRAVPHFVLAKSAIRRRSVGSKSPPMFLVNGSLLVALPPASLVLRVRR